MDIEHMIHDPNVIAGLCGLGAFGVVVLVWVAMIEEAIPCRRALRI